MFNTFATSLAIGAYACWEQDISFSLSSRFKLLKLSLPFIYARTRDHELFKREHFFLWLIVAVVTSLFLFGILNFGY